MDPDEIFTTAGRGVISLIVISALLGWARQTDPGGPFTFLLDSIATIASLVFDPSMALLVFAAGAVIAMLPGDDRF